MATKENTLTQAEALHSASQNFIDLRALALAARAMAEDAEQNDLSRVLGTIIEMAALFADKADEAAVMKGGAA